MSWLIIENEYQPEEAANWEAIFSLGNGYLITRGYPEEGSDHPRSMPDQYVAGVYGWHSKQSMAMANLPTWKAFGLKLAGEDLKLSKQSVSGYRRTLNMANGMLSRSFVWTSPSGKKTRLDYDTMISWDRRHVMAQRLSVSAIDWNGEVELIHTMNTASMLLGECIVEHVSAKESDNHGIAVDLATVKTGINVGIRVGMECTKRCATDVLKTADNRIFTRSTRFDVSKGSSVICFRCCSVCSDFENRTREGKVLSKLSAGERAKSELDGAMKAGWDVLVHENDIAWKKKWEECDVKVYGDDVSQQKIRWHLFQLMQTYRGDDNRLNLDAKLMTGQEYAGHYFWDTDLYAFPFFLFTMPYAGKSLVEYRALSLKGAEDKAKMFGYKGAFYPWESDPTGSENCPLSEIDKDGKEIEIPYGRIQLHVNADVVYGFDQYRLASGDEGFWFEKAAPVILQSARFFADRGKWDGEEFIIKNVMCPDEYHRPVDNSAYTNYTAKWNILKALEILEKAPEAARSRLEKEYGITADEKKQWKSIVQKIRIPFSERHNIIEEADGFTDLPEFEFGKYSKDNYLYKQLDSDDLTKYQVVKQADLIALFRIMPFAFDRDLMKRCWDYYVPRTVHDSSLSHGSHAVVASYLGLQDDAWKHYKMVLETDLDFHGNKYHTYGGVHAANAGNAWAGAVQGFGGIHLDENALWCSPRLPKHWNKLEFQIYYKNRRCRFTIEADKVTVDVAAGDPVYLVICGVGRQIGKSAVKVSVDRRNRACIFDLDGVLTDTAPCHYKAWKSVADRLGIKFDEEKNHLLRGVSRRRSLEIMIEGQIKLTEEQMSQCMEEKNIMFARMIDEEGMSLLLPGVKPFLSRLRMSGLRLAVASASKNAKTILKNTLLLNDYFDAIADGTDTKRAKPDPEVFLCAAKRVNAEPRDCLVFEDAPAGIDAAIAGGMGSVGLGPADVGHALIRVESIAEMNVDSVFAYFGKNESKE